MMGKRPTVEELREHLHYFPETGEIVWKNSLFKRVEGKLAGHVTHGKYRRIILYDKRFYYHHAAWALFYGEWPEKLIDHIDGDQSNNRIKNLRQADKAQNGHNRGVTRKNKLGVKGICLTREGRYRAEIRAYGKAYHIGHFRTLEEAQAAYAVRASELHGEFARVK